MNAKGLPVMLQGVLSTLEMPFYQDLVTDGSVSQSEFEGTIHNLKAVIAILKDTPEEKIEALVAQHDEDLTTYLQKINDLGQVDTLDKFRNAQIMAGYVQMILTKAGIR